MALQTTTQIFISGTPIKSYVSLKLHQEIQEHHDLELVCRTDVVESLSNELIGDSKEYLGGIITVKINVASTFGKYKELEFKGVITKVQGTRGFHQDKGDLVSLFAKSTSILSDDGSHYASFVDVGLSEILDAAFQGYDQGKLETSFSPVSTDTIHYTVQHNQSAFNFARRLAAYHNEWFYYDGKKLVFGNPGTEETELSYGVDLINLSIELSSIPNSFEYFTNDYLTDEVHQRSSASVSVPSEGYHGFTNKKSKELFNKQTQVYHHSYNDTAIKSRLDNQVEQHTKSIAMKQVIAKGASDNPGIKLGEVITIKGYGSYRIIKITHTNTEGGFYKNEFEAVDANFTAYPKMDLNQYPKSDIQIATVVENSDPDGLSRIKVQFPWQKPMGEITPWLRMMTPHAGSDKGFHFIPEIGEEVVVNFEGGNAERPFILGTFYHGTARPDSWQTNANNIKAIRSRSGHTVELNDTEGGEMITITDKKGNHFIIDTVSETISINALKDLNINAGENIQITAGKNISINAGENIGETAGENVSIIANKDMLLNAAGEMTEIADNRNDIIDEDFSRQSSISEEYANEISLFSAEENLTIQSSKTVNINSAEKSKLF
ncbi:type VI secretion system Vgr family protein [Aquimarina algicola]|uniref:Gp5/Type VI secretion system Vgr protein OB-fold domain-containing protein n=1 Tax=Aquimarina algicola TaxID=2589995 RepID=A0A504JQF3_9FLAO|nr:phage baseplate assembly protein V [Aquimarina algicola]TPN89079.1 hypothetical protein FHK87_02335 [Aquimarina algicola]